MIVTILNNFKMFSCFLNSTPLKETKISFVEDRFPHYKYADGFLNNLLSYTSDYCVQIRMKKKKQKPFRSSKSVVSFYRDSGWWMARFYAVEFRPETAETRENTTNSAAALTALSRKPIRGHNFLREIRRRIRAKRRLIVFRVARKQTNNDYSTRQ